MFQPVSLVSCYITPWSEGLIDQTSNGTALFKDNIQPTDLIIKPSGDALIDQEARWDLIESYVINLLTGGDVDVNSYMAAVQAVFDTELEGVPTLRLLNYAPPVGKGVWNEWLGRQHVHGLRTKVLNLIRQFRGKHRLETITEGDSPESGSTSTGGITDEVFLQRWTKAAKIFAHHDRNYAQKRSGGAPWWGGPCFVYDGATTMFDLGKRAWLGLDVGAEFGAEMRKREEEDF